MSGYPLFFPEFVFCTNSSLFWFKIANELSEFRNYLLFLNTSKFFLYSIKPIRHFGGQCCPLHNKICTNIQKKSAIPLNHHRYSGFFLKIQLLLPIYASQVFC